MSLNKLDHCRSCLGWSWGSKGYVPADGSGTNGVLVVLEAAGEHEAEKGIPVIGKAGYYLWQNLQRVGIEREGFRIHNVLSCQPPDNKLSKMPYEAEVIAHCAPLLDATVADMQEKCAKNLKHLVILPLGKIAFKRIMGITDRDPILKESYLCYPFWSEKYNCWVMPGEHPSFLMRGNNHRLPILQFVFQRALNIAEHGLELEEPNYLIDPSPITFMQWTKDCLEWMKEHPEDPIVYDIETAYKRGKKEDEISREEEGDDYTILRISFAYKPGIVVSVPWRAEYLPGIEELFASPFQKAGWNSSAYDFPRVSSQVVVNGPQIDVMLMWHVLNSSLDKDLGSVTPFYVKNVGLWKHLSLSNPGLYNSFDSDMELRCYFGIKKDLIKNNLWGVFERHIVKLGEVLSYMSAQGVLRDEELRNEAEKKVGDLLDVTEIKMEASVPQEAKKLKVYKKTPKNTEGMIQVEKIMPVKRCSICGLEKPTKPHFKEASKRKKAQGLDNACEAGEVVIANEPVKLWAQVLPFKVSKVSLLNYQNILRHQAVLSRKEKKVTFDEVAIKKLIKHHPSDPLYPLILEHREYSKLLSTYIGVTQDGKVVGGMPIGQDGKIHTLFTHNPSTLRLASQDPNCFDAQTEILTENGWKLFPLLEKTDKVAQWSSGYITFVYPEAIQKISFSGKMIKLDSEHIQLRMTDNHRCLILTRKGQEKVVSAIDYPPDHKQLHAGVYDNGGILPLTDTVIQLVCAMQADGSWCDTINPSIEWVFSKPRKITRIIHLLDKAKVTYSISRKPQQSGTRIRVGVGKLPNLLWKFLGHKKEFGPWILKMNQHQLKVFTNELFEWDGLSTRRNNYGSIVEANVDWAQIAFLLTGRRAHKRIYWGNKSKQPHYQIDITNRNYSFTTNVVMASTNVKNEEVYCVTVPSGYVIVRRGQDACITGNCQNLPRPKGSDALATMIRNMIIAGPGQILHARDFSGIEAVLSGYDACSKEYIRLAKRDVHSFYTAYALYELEGRIPANDLPQLSWSDEKLFTRLAEIKKEFKSERNNLYKHLVHAANFFQGAKGAQEKIYRETGIEVPLGKIKRVMDIYFELFPEIRRWHNRIWAQAERDGFLRNAFGYIHRFSRVYSYTKEGRQWTKRPGDDANRVAAFGPQSTAAGIIKEAMLRLYFERFEEAGQYLRLQVHDELLIECPESEVDRVDAVMKEEMEKHIPELVLPASYGMGSCLNIDTEAKTGYRWASMKGR